MLFTEIGSLPTMEWFAVEVTMKSWIFFLCLIFSLHGYDPDRVPEVASLENGGSVLVGGRVHAITGDIIEYGEDLIIPGFENLAVQHFFNRPRASEDLLSSWQLNFNQKLVKDKRVVRDSRDLRTEFASKEVFYIVKDGPCSFALTDNYKGRDEQKEYAFDRSQLVMGMTNLARGVPSARTNLKNLLLKVDPTKLDINGQGRELTDGSGTVKGFRKDGSISKIKRPSGCVEQFFYKGSDLLVISLRSRKNCPMGDIFIKEDDLETDNPYLTCRTRDGRSVKYQFKKLRRNSEKDTRVRHHVTEIIPSNGPRVIYKYDPPQKYYGERLQAIYYPNNRYCMFSHYYPGKTWVCYSHALGKDYNPVIETTDPVVGNVRALLQPAGVDRMPVITHRFLYHYQHGEDGLTEVFDAHNHLTTYHFDPNFTYKKTVFWQGRGKGEYVGDFCDEQIMGSGKDLGNVLVHRIYSKKESLEKAVDYTYDNRGNVVEVRCWNNLTGHNPNVATITKEGKVKGNDADMYRKEYTYSEDGYNLIRSERLPNGVEIKRDYLPDSDLLTKELVYDGGLLLKRRFWDYDAHGVCIKEVFDDGASDEPSCLEGVTSRRITKIVPNLETPFGLPKEIEKYGFDPITKQEQLISKEVIEYHCLGQPSKKWCYGSDLSLLYVLEFDYDRCGNCIYETTPLGDVIQRHYDDNGNMELECGPHPLRKKLITYDFMNRPIKEEEIVGDLVLTTLHRYNHLSHRIETVDSFGNSTHFTNDRYGRVIEEQLPPFVDQFGQLVRPSTKKEYDIFGRVTKHIDALGNETDSTYNFYDKPATIHYPDGTEERNIYNLDGTLKESVAKNGMSTQYEYDHFEHPLVKRLLSKDGVELSVEKFSYKGDKLISYIDAEGAETRYEYDFAGRQSAIITGDRKETFEYDAGSQLLKKRIYGGEYLIATYVTERDCMGRVKKEWVEDQGVHLLKTFGYDCLGNCTIETIGDSVITREYDPLGRLVSETDPEGYTTHTFYNHRFVNSEGQLVLQKRVVDPNGLSTFTTYDTHHREAEVEKRTSVGAVVSLTKNRYNGAGQCVEISHQLYGRAGEPELIAYEYDSLGRPSKRIDAPGSPHQRITSIKYNDLGEKSEVIKPNGVQLLYSYDDKGQLSTFSSSDWSISYSYKYDRMGRLTSVVDEKNGERTVRHYTKYGEIDKEDLGNGLSLRYKYDALSRPVVITLPDQSSVVYHYNSTSMTCLQRLRPTGALHYEHLYEEFDVAGRVTKEVLINQAGVRTQRYTPSGWLSSTTHVLHSTSDILYDGVGNILSYELKDEVGTSPMAFEYDPLNQLTKEEDYSYTYDSLYNRISKNGVDYQIGPHNDINSDGDYSYKFDWNGNMIEKSGARELVSYTYDPLNRLTSVTKNGQTTTYHYDVFGRRLRKTFHDGSVESYLYENDREVGKVVDGVLVEFRVLGLGLGAEIGATIAIECEGTVLAPLHDFHGNIVALISPSGTLTASTRYSAFGETRSPLSPYGFASKRLDPESGLIYFGRRYYDPAIGRWTSPDPLAMTPPCNLYTFVTNCPLTHLDPFGLFDLFGSFSEDDPLGPELDPFGLDSYKNLPDSSLFTFTSSWPHAFDSSYPGCFREDTILSGSQIPDICVDFCPGIGVSYEEAIEGGKYLQALLGGVEVVVIHLASAGTYQDIINKGHELNHWARTPHVEKVMKTWRNQLATSSNQHIIPFCYSGGAITGRNAHHFLGEDLNQRIYPIAISPGAYFHTPQALHIRSEKDLVPSLDMYGEYIAQTTTVTVPRAPNAPWFDHAFKSPSFSRHIEKQFNNTLKQINNKIYGQR